MDDVAVLRHIRKMPLPTVYVSIIYRTAQLLLCFLLAWLLSDLDPRCLGASLIITCWQNIIRAMCSVQTFQRVGNAMLSVVSDIVQWSR